MKKRTKIIFSVLVVAAVLAATYRVVNRPPSASLESSAQMEEIIASSGCMACMGHRTKRILRIERKEYQTY